LRRAELVILALALTGCMKIYPDPELPDVTAMWQEQDCRDGSGNVAITLTGVDTDSTTTSTVPCKDLTVTFADIARLRYHVKGALLDLAGNELITSDGEDVDLRNGFDQSVGLYFEGFSNFRVAWVFDGGGSCASVGAQSVGIVFSLPGEPDIEASQSWCEFPRITGMVIPDTYTAHLEAFSGQQRTVVAVSPETAPFVITQNGFTDIGTLTLTPCGAACP
jgi:hypothetical protein